MLFLVPASLSAQALPTRVTIPTYIVSPTAEVADQISEWKNLLQQDMVAMRFVMRLAYAMANPLTRLQPTEASRSPFSVLRDAA